MCLKDVSILCNFFLLHLIAKLVALYLELFQLKYGDRWLHMYEVGKISLNNRGNELSAEDKRSSNPGVASAENDDE